METQTKLAGQLIVGSAEPLSREQTLVRLRELEAWGVDLTLVRANLCRTPEQRIAQNESLARLIAELQATAYAGRSGPLLPSAGLQSQPHRP
jgi:hypothetical protein